ncbi:MAG: hypothetical protein KGY99_01505 [Phycisphaerae bacterium]|nr:hypothetical protein [Phycisphaerae bacterium]
MPINVLASCKASRVEGAQLPGRLSKLAAVRFGGRSGRVILLVMCLVLMNVFDLVLTLMAHAYFLSATQERFIEANPIARSLLTHPERLIAFKLILAGSAAAILIVLRRRRIAEIACWALCGVYAALSVIWFLYYGRL